MRIAFLICLIFTVNITCAQAQPNYLVYHKEIIEAERKFLKDSISQSLLEYKEIFKKYTPFARDAYIALELACMLKDTAYANFFLLKCFQCGINWEVLNRVSHIRRYLEAGDIKNVRKLYDKEHKIYLNTLNLSLRRFLISLSKKDDTGKGKMFNYKNSYLRNVELQDEETRRAYDKTLAKHSILKKYREKKGDSTSAAYETIKRTLRNSYVPASRYDTLYVEILEQNILILDSISKKLGYVPGDRTIGIIDHVLDKYAHPIHSEKFAPVTVHAIYHHGCGFWMMKDQLLESIRKGELHPRYYAVMYDYSYCDLKDKSYNSSLTDLQRFYKIKCTLPLKEKTYNVAAFNCPMEAADRKFVNMCREELSISTIEHDEQKKNYAKRHHLILSFGLLGVEL